MKAIMINMKKVYMDTKQVTIQCILYQITVYLPPSPIFAISSPKSVY